MTGQLNEIEAMQAVLEGKFVRKGTGYIYGNVDGRLKYRYETNVLLHWELVVSSGIVAGYGYTIVPDPIQPAPTPMTADGAMRAEKRIRITAPFLIALPDNSPPYPCGFAALALEADRQIAAGNKGWRIEVLD